MSTQPAGDYHMISRISTAAPNVTPGITTERDVRNTVTPWSHPDEVGYPPAAPAQGESIYALEYTTSDGKYTVQQTNMGALVALRYGQEWRNCVGDNLVLRLAQDAATLRQQLAAVEKERDEAREQWRMSSVCRELQTKLTAATEALEKIGLISESCEVHAIANIALKKLRAIGEGGKP